MRKVLSFRMNQRLFGIETRYVKEINRNVEYTVVPTAPKSIAGLLNMRGQVVTIFDLAHIFGYPPDDRKKMCIILKSANTNQNQVGFLIDKTEDVFDLQEEECDSLPANTEIIDQKYISMVAKLEKELLMIIDTEHIINETH